MAVVDQQSLAAVKRFAIGVGSIDPDARVKSGELTDSVIDEFMCALLGETFYGELAKETQGEVMYFPFVPSVCVDGRLCPEHPGPHGPNAAGGTATVAIADALVHGGFYRKGEDFVAHAEHVFSALKEMGYTLGGHTAAAHGMGTSGCGACDKLMIALTYIAEHGDNIRRFLLDAGVEVDDELHERLVANAKELIVDGYASDTGEQMNGALVEVAGQDASEKLRGDHGEVGLVINTAEGTSLDRGAVVRTVGEGLQVFNLDMWAFEKVGQVMTLGDEPSVRAFVTALLYHNVATAAVLAGPSLRVVIR